VLCRSNLIELFVTACRHRRILPTTCDTSNWRGSGMHVMPQSRRFGFGLLEEFVQGPEEGGD
jgi:hypothetical protein